MSDPNETSPGTGQKPKPPAGQPAAPQPAGETAPHPRPAAPPQPPPVQIGGNVGGDVAGRDLNKELNAGRDIVGRDAVTNTNTTNVGFTATAVQRLLLTVGALVFVTAACFFSGGAVAGAGIVALARPLNSNNPAAADRFAADLAALQGLPAGTRFEFTFSEEEISSYFRLRVAPNLPGNITDGKLRLLDSGQLVAGGRAGSLGGLPFAATFNWQDTPGRPLRLTGAAVQILPAGNSIFGWVLVPTAALGSVEDTINNMFGNVQITGTRRSADGQEWTVTGVAR
jgi:hypothetical protein